MLLKLLPANVIAEVIGFLIETAIIIGITWHVVAGHYELKEAADLAKAQQVAAAQYQAKDKAYNDVAAQLETVKAQKNVVYSTITHEVEKVVTQPIYSNSCLDDAGLRLVNTAFAGQLPASAAIVAPTVPAASAASGNNGR